MSHKPRPQPLPDTLLAAVGVHATYPGSGEVLDCAALQVRAGVRLVLLGRNGSGKTTLLRCLSGAHHPTAGTIETPGGVLRHTRAGLTRHRQFVQLVLQDPDDQLFGARVGEDVSFGPMNLGLPPDQVRHRVTGALQALGITELAERPTHHLSYGQRKRVAIAGALAMRPAVLLLDEPTAGLDPHGVTQLLAALDTLEAAGTTVALSTHDVDLAWQWADEVAVVRSGSVAQDALTKVLTDRAVLAGAGLRLPWPVQLLREMGHEIDPLAPPRTVPDVARALSGPGSGRSPHRGSP